MPVLRSDLDYSAIVPGSVVQHQDDDGCHHAIVIGIHPKGGQVDLLMFSSKKLGYRWRAVTREELALTAYVSSCKTYMSLKVRSLYNLTPCGIEIPEHRLEELQQEFLSVPEGEGDPASTFETKGSGITLTRLLPAVLSPR